MNPREFGQRVYRLRMEKKWTQVMCADRVGISLRNLRMIESYLSSPTLETVEKLAAAFGCSWNDLLGMPEGKVSFDKHAKAK
jgi:transcriptional regulator with XRE-family HTH domain